MNPSKEVPRGRPKKQLPPCRFCKKEFKRSEHLKRHELIHTRERPFQCRCGQTFSRQDQKIRHERLHGPEASIPGSDVTPLRPWAMKTSQRPTFQLESPTQLNRSVRQSPLSGGTTVGNYTLPSVEDHSQMDMTQDGLNLTGLPWDTDAFFFPDYIPSQFLDTDISLSDLLQQVQTPKEPEMQALPEAGPAFQARAHRSQSSHNELHENLNLAHPPRFPSMDDQLDHSNLDTRSDHVNCPWAVSPAGYRVIVQKITSFKPALRNISIPSKCAFVRYLEGYFRNFHNHLPFLHVASFRPENVGVELLLAMTAIGAFYCFEHTEGYHLYCAIRSSVDSMLQSRRESLVSQLNLRGPTPRRESIMIFDSPSSRYNSAHTPETPQSNSASLDGEDPQSQLERAQALIILTAMGAWGDKSLLQDSLAMSNQLAILVRQLGINKSDDAQNDNLGWVDWVVHEQKRRTLLVAYIVLNLNSILADVPPVILTREVALCLPSCEAEWGAVSSAAWQRHRDVSALRERSFVQNLDQLFNGSSICSEWGVSAFSNYLLIHGIIQKIYLEIQIPKHSQGASPIRPELLKTYETALRLWQQSWETTWESTLDPNSPKGPIGLNATALLRLAYIRLNIRIGMCHDFVTSDTSQIKAILSDIREIRLCRSPPLDRAILQCIHALSIPVRIGIQNVARTQVMHSGIHHSLCYLECALFLALWLQNISQAVQYDGMATLRGDELKLLAMAKGLVKETHLQRSIDYQEDTAGNILRLAVAISRLWAEISSGSHVFDIVHRIGTCLSIVADALESEIIIS